MGLTLDESTLLAANLPGGRILQVTEKRALVADLESGMVTFEWTSPTQKAITAASASNEHLVLATGGQVLASFDIQNNTQLIMEKDLGVDQQISGVTVPSNPPGVCIVGFPQSAKISVIDIKNLSELQTKSLGETGEAFPRSVLVANVLADSPPTLFISMADGSVITFSLDPNDYSLTSMNRLILNLSNQRSRSSLGEMGCTTCSQPARTLVSFMALKGELFTLQSTLKVHLAYAIWNAEAYPDSIAVATARELKIALVDKERTTQIQTLPVGSTVRRVAYSPSEKAFGLGTIDRKLEDGLEAVKSHFVLADEILFRRLDALELKPEELMRV